MLKLSRDALAVEEVWWRKGVSETKTDALHSMISPPYLRDDHIYGVDSYGELRCLDATTGDRLWENIGGAWGPSSPTVCSTKSRIRVWGALAITLTGKRCRGWTERATGRTVRRR